jgi:tetratricopeptide (TPR) repeat protein
VTPGREGRPATPDAGATAGPHAWAIVVLAVVAANLPALFPGFIFDDHRLIEQNELVRDPANLPAIFARGYWTVGDEPVPSLYRPLTVASFALNHALFGPSALSFRVVNLLLHALVTVLVLALARRALGPPRPGEGVDPALAAALLFAVHPVHTEALGLVVGRAETLAAAGTLGCVVLFLRARERDGAGRAGEARRDEALALACAAFGFLAKENAVVAPFLAILAGGLLLRRGPGRRFAVAAVVVLAALLGLRTAVLGALSPPGFVSYVDNPIAHEPALTGRLTALKVVARYAGLLVFPARMSVDYSYDAVPLAAGWRDPEALLGAALLLAGAVGSWILGRRHGAAALGLLWMGLALAPVANLAFPIGTIMADRLLYLPSVGLCLLAGGFIAARVRARGAGEGQGALATGALRASLAIFLVALAARGVVRYLDWRDDYTLFRAAVEVVPRSVKAQFNLGAACEERGDDEAAIAAYRAAIAIHPVFADAHYNLGGVLMRGRDWDGAVRHLGEAARLQPGNVQYLVNLAIALTGQGRPEAAVDPLTRALELDPRSDRARTALGNARLALGDPDGAAREYAEAIRIVPQSADHHRNLGLALSERGDTAGAVRAFRTALDLRPRDGDLAVALGGALVEAGESGEGLALLERAVAAAPGHPVFRYRYGRALEAAGRAGEAETQYREAIRLAPGVPMPRRALGMMLFRRGERGEARDQLERAAALDRDGKVMDEEARRALAALTAGR